MTTHEPPKKNIEKVALYQQRQKALATYPPPASGVLINGIAHPAAELSATYQAGIDTRTNLTAARDQEKVCLAKRSAADAAIKTIDKGLLNWSAATFGEDSPQAKAYGYVARSATPPTTAVKARAAEQAQETKKARGIMGKKQRKTVKSPQTPSPTGGSSPKG